MSTKTKSSKKGPTTPAMSQRSGKAPPKQARPFCFGKKLPRWAREFLAEFIGTYMLLMMGQAAIAGYELQRNMDLFSVAFCFGVAAMIGVAMAQNISG